ncbi:hypothetical protein SPRG_17660 [Saprolegnia parasitica CBS 223.65]|uniref:Uncharacterized protein n=1 Tax=Saprolegnia parasitica (strain CBS 223.65) TaxID=695850 RepID=A0A067BFE8_SAPPC|nr:hypothetical protein SPRG_17660 [Saprolegnia parasitica CBS 223.65]KDO16858.1 hypothetical protein SPRG_17660 [Saprolegnia parasitica CBS 223.65]|eukprot:XP_012212434.1 hypothetical protein SPRG_17660 [Saprolegnia parasitica CBS 223.65]
MWRRRVASVVQRRWSSTCAVTRADGLIALIKQAPGRNDDDDARDYLRATSAIDLRGTDAYGSTALTLAARGGHLELCRDLLDALIRHAALHRARRASGHIDVCHLLLGAGVDVDVRTRYGSTALSKAAEAGHAAIVDALLAAGATSSPNALGKTPFELAQAKGHKLPQLEEAPINDERSSARVTSWRSATLIECQLASTGEFVLVEKTDARQRTPINAAPELVFSDGRWCIAHVPASNRPVKQRCLHPRRPFENKCVDCPDKR